MTNFDETVKKLASAPHRAALLSLVPQHFSKNAGVASTLFGASVKDSTGLNKVLQTAAGASLGAATIGLGSLVFSKLKNNILGNEDEEKAQHVELGKLQAQNQFKHQSVSVLEEQHKAVLKKVLQDEIIGKADKALMHSTFGTMTRFAPNLAADENAAKSFLREHAIYNMGPSYAALKNLADAEQAVARAGGVV